MLPRFSEVLKVEKLNNLLDYASNLEIATAFLLTRLKDFVDSMF